MLAKFSRQPASTVERSLTRPEFYRLAHECRDYALRLANYDQASVNPQLCREFNEFRERVRSYDRLHEPLQRMRPARPITRGIVVAVVLSFWLAISLAGSRLLNQFSLILFLSGTSVVLLTVYLVPPALYGTSVEAIEGRVMLVVQALLKILASGELEFSEAAYFVVRDVLQQAADELRQQVYLSRTSGLRG